MSRLVRALSQFTQSEITALKQNARVVIRHPAGMVLATPVLNAQTGRILVVIAKKVGSAPERNKIRRQLKSIFYEEKLYQRGFDWIVIVRPPAVDLSFAQLKELMLQANSMVLS